MPTHTIAKGDSLTPLGVQLKQKDDTGALAVRDLTSKTVKVLVVTDDDEETVVVAETTTGVTVVTAATGKVQYDFPTNNTTLNAGGTFRVYFRVYGSGGESTERDTHPIPIDEKRMKVTFGSL